MCAAFPGELSGLWFVVACLAAKLGFVPDPEASSHLAAKEQVAEFA